MSRQRLIDKSHDLPALALLKLVISKTLAHEKMT